MNGKDHVKKGLPILEDVLGGFAALVSENDEVSPILRTDLVGRHTVGTGSSPQAVITALVTTPLEKAGWKITDIDKYSVEMQNPDITKPAGAGDVPEANYKMIGALAVKRQELERSELPNFVTKHGMPGWAPTQGHIPSGVPYLGFAHQDLTTGGLNRAMVVGKREPFSWADDQSVRWCFNRAGKESGKSCKGETSDFQRRNQKNDSREHERFCFPSA